jgi:N-acetylglucosaminyldiphosphoundecaprenol N-acetyl-beta-D-mannosaminyltransferase
MIDLGKKNLLGVSIDAMDYEAAVKRIIDAAGAGKRCTVTALAVHGVMTAADPSHQYRLNHMDLVVPDGQPVRWALNALYGTGLSDRVYGPKLTLKVCAEAARQGIPVYFYGSSREVVEKLAQRMGELTPGLKIAGYRPSLFRLATQAEREATVREIRDSGAKILFAGLGCPRQEVFAYEMGQYLDMPILAVGAAFDYHSGTLAEPPEWIQRSGLQWLYRLIQEPRRLWQRYLVLNTQFVAGFLLQFLKVRTVTASRAIPPANDLLYG